MFPAYEGPTVFTDRYPTFAVVNGKVMHRIGGANKVMGLRDSVTYRRHGSFRVIAARGNCGMLVATTPSGVAHNVLIPECQHVTFKDGTIYSECLVKDFGFVCPEWAREHWNRNECTIEPCTDGSYIVLDHSLNGVVIYVGVTANECRRWMNTN